MLWISNVYDENQETKRIAMCLPLPPFLSQFMLIVLVCAHSYPISQKREAPNDADFLPDITS